MPLRENYSEAMGDAETALQHEVANEEYLQRMAKPGEWGDGVMLSCACRLYRRPLRLVLSDNSVVNIDANNHDTADVNATSNPLYIGYYTAGTHYVNLVPKSDHQPAPSDNQRFVSIFRLSCAFRIHRCIQHVG